MNVNVAAWLMQNEVLIRLSSFGMMFLLLAFWEWRAPCRTPRFGRLLRWSNNLGLVVLDSVFLRLLFPVAAVGVALYAEQQGYGFFNLITMPLWLEVLLAVIALDLLIYLQHVLFHKVPWLWAVHRVHHADPDYDLTTGIRFHPIEIVLSMLIKMAAIMLLGPAAVAVVIFELVLNLSAMFNHANIQLPAWLESRLRWLLVTPDMHRVHHSQRHVETDSNYGFALSCWDRLFGTYTERPQHPQQTMAIGLAEFQEPRIICWLPGQLLLPFRKRG